jgi:hypothetical protein
MSDLYHGMDEGTFEGPKLSERRVLRSAGEEGRGRQGERHSSGFKFNEKGKLIKTMARFDSFLSASFNKK